MFHHPKALHSHSKRGCKIFVSGAVLWGKHGEFSIARQRHSKAQQGTVALRLKSQVDAHVGLISRKLHTGTTFDSIGSYGQLIIDSFHLNLLLQCCQTVIIAVTTTTCEPGPAPIPRCGLSLRVNDFLPLRNDQKDLWSKSRKSLAWVGIYDREPAVQDDLHRESDCL